MGDTDSLFGLNPEAVKGFQSYRNMNKIYSDQIQKATMLSQGIRTNDALLKQNNINLDAEKIEVVAKALEEASAAQEKAEEELATRRDAAHLLLAELKELCNESKQPIKEKFPLEKWQKFGLPDKR